MVLSLWLPTKSCALATFSPRTNKNRKGKGKNTQRNCVKQKKRRLRYILIGFNVQLMLYDDLIFWRKWYLLLWITFLCLSFHLWLPNVMQLACDDWVLGKWTNELSWIFELWKWKENLYFTNLWVFFVVLYSVACDFSPRPIPQPSTLFSEEFSLISFDFSYFAFPII